MRKREINFFVFSFLVLSIFGSPTAYAKGIDIFAGSFENSGGSERVNTDEKRIINTEDVELGVILGEPTGISGKIWTTWNTAADFGIAWSFAKDGYLHMHADYLFHNFYAFKVDEGELPVYFGVGGRIRFEDDMRAGLRVSAGMAYYFESCPISIFMEIAPIFDFIPETETGMNGGAGIRYIF